MYTPNPTWVNGSAGSTPIDSAALNHLEQGVLAASEWELSAVANPLTGWFHVDGFGAVGDGVTDDTAAIQSAWSALLTNGGGVLYFDKTYLTTGVVLQGGSNFTVQAARGAGLLTKPNTASAPYQGTHNVLTIADCTDFIVDGITADGRRDTLMGDQYVQSNISTNATTVVVSDGTEFCVGELFSIYGGFAGPITGAAGNAGAANQTVTGSEQDRQDALRTITGISGNTLTFTPSASNAYTATGSSGGAYVSRYQTALNTHNTVAGRTLGNENQQNGLHLISCQRFILRGVEARNVWESPIKMGTGFEGSSITDGCSKGVVTGCVVDHGYDQGISVWRGQDIAVVGNIAHDAGWAGVCFTHSLNCVATGNVSSDNLYSVPGDRHSGSGIAVEGGQRVVVNDNILRNNNTHGVRLDQSPLDSPSGSATLSSSASAMATTISVSNAGGMAAGTSFTILDAAKPTTTECVFVESVSGTTITLVYPLRYPHASGSSLVNRYCDGCEVVGNTIDGSGVKGVSMAFSLRSQSVANTIMRSGQDTDIFGANGVYVGSGSEGCTVKDNVVHASAAEGIFCENSSGLDVSGNRLNASGLPTNGKHGILINNCPAPRVCGNIVEGSSDAGVGINPNGGSVDRAIVHGNVSRYNAAQGIIILGGHLHTAVGNECTDNTGGSGLDFRSCEWITATSNILVNNSEYGFRADDTTNSRVTANMMVNDSGSQQWGAHEGGSSTGNIYRDNVATGNTSGADSLLGTSTWS